MCLPQTWNVTTSMVGLNGHIRKISPKMVNIAGNAEEEEEADKEEEEEEAEGEGGCRTKKWSII